MISTRHLILYHSLRRQFNLCQSILATPLLSTKHPAQILACRYLASHANPPKRLQICVVGSGPAGFYTVSQLLKSFGEDIHVSLLERLPTPYGLVRSGVAPDHPETKNVINQFSALGCDNRVGFMGNVNVGHAVPLSVLRSIYDGVVLAYGAESNRTLDISGRHSEGVFTAREFVWWYNGHPECCTLPIDLSKVRSVSILGLGNVALDCARILLQSPERLEATDIAAHALSQLKRSAVQQVDVIGRRGPAQAAFTAKELREVLNMDDISVMLPPEDMVISSMDESDLKRSRARKRVFELLQTASQGTDKRKEAKTLRLRFLRSPVEILSGQLGRVQGLKLEAMQLQEQAGRQIAIATGSTEEIPADLILESIGYKSLPLPGAPFDEQHGIIPNRQGRVGSSEGVEKGLYVCGWLKRGPSGIIGTNLADAQETVRSICEDIQNGALQSQSPPQNAWQTLKDYLSQREVKVVTFDDWLKIDKEERLAGEKEGRERIKFIDVEEMLKAAVNA